MSDTEGTKTETEIETPGGGKVEETTTAEPGGGDDTGAGDGAGDSGTTEA